MFWPGRSEVLFARGATIAGLDYQSGVTRTLVTFPDSVRLVGFDRAGDFLVIRAGAGFTLLERAGTNLNVRADVSFAETSADLFDAIGVVR